MRKYCNATNLKFFAIALMFLDHIHQMFVPVGAPMWLTYLGRPVFPLLLFLAADSFHYTHDRKAYLKRLLFASWFMTIASFLIQNLVRVKDVVLMNNAFSTFFVAGLYMLFWDRFVEGIREKSGKKIVTAILLCFVPILTAAPMLAVGQLSFNENIPTTVIRALAMVALLVPNVLTCEGGIVMMALGVAFYIFRKHRWVQIALLAALSALLYTRGSFQWMMVFAAIPMMLYNGEKGAGMKKFFYIFYPAHIYGLYLLAAIVSRLS